MAKVSALMSNGETITINLKKTHLLISIVVILLVGGNALTEIVGFFSKPETEAIPLNLQPLQKVINDQMYSLRDTVTSQIDQHVNDKGAHRWIIDELRDNELKEIRDDMGDMRDDMNMILSHLLPQARQP
jgi:hypothetical protein